MPSAIVINLDYEGRPVERCRRVWESVDRHFQAAGFSRHRRVFVSPLDNAQAVQTAKAVLNSVEREMEAEGIAIFDIIAEFYCFAFDRMNDLLDPVHHKPDVSFLDTGAFRAYLPPKEE